MPALARDWSPRRVCFFSGELRQRCFKEILEDFLLNVVIKTWLYPQGEEQVILMHDGVG